MVETSALPFEEFSKEGKYGYPKWNNMFLPFVSEEGSIYREKLHFQRFKEEHLDFEKKLSKRAKNQVLVHDGLFTHQSPGALRPLARELYEVYKIMRSYGFSDAAIFA